MKSYREMSRLETFAERFEYLKENGTVGQDTFGDERYLNQALYASGDWKRIRRQVIVRDGGCDLGMPELRIGGRIYIHHINPISPEDIIDRNPEVLNLDNLVCCSRDTHYAIHFGVTKKEEPYIERTPNDTCPWRKHE